MPDARTANLLGALALAVADVQVAAARRATGLSASACAALVSLGAYPGATIGELARVLGLTHSVAVRLAEALVAAGLVTRKQGGDRRQVALRLTPAGSDARAAILAARAAVLDGALEGLGEADRARFGELAAAMLKGLTCGREGADHLCRLCDEDACPSDSCPVEQEAVRLERGA